VMGVIADLAGKQVDPMPDLADRDFMAVDIDNFDDRMKSIKPRVAFQVPNTLTGEGQMNVDITFDSMDDFSPARIARQVGALQHLLEARTELSNLLSYMDGKNGAEQLIAQALQNPELLKSLASAPNPAVAKAVEAPNEKSGGAGTIPSE
jgi:type VI secretion system protein ImpB